MTADHTLSTQLEAMRKQHLQALLDRVTSGTLCTGTLAISADDCAMINACFPDDISDHGMFETASATEAIGLIMDGSLDAAVAFAHAVLPHWGWHIGNEGEAAIFFGEYGQRFDAAAVNPARALLISALMALIAVAK